MTGPARVLNLARRVEALRHHAQIAHPAVRPQLDAEAAHLAVQAERVARQSALLDQLQVRNAA